MSRSPQPDNANTRQRILTNAKRSATQRARFMGITLVSTAPVLHPSATAALAKCLPRDTWTGLMDSTAHRVDAPAATTNETWHQNGHNLCEVIVIRSGPAPNGTRYIDGVHQIRVALFEAKEDAAAACAAHNASFAAAAPEWDYMGFCG